MDKTEIFNFDQTADLCIRQFTSFELSETAEKFSLNLDDPIACFAIASFLTTKQWLESGRKTKVKETIKTLSEIQNTTRKLAKLINDLPKHEVRDWFDVGDEVESWRSDRNPAVLQCIVWASIAGKVSDLISVPDGNYNPFLNQFLRWYLCALAKYPVKSKDELKAYIESSINRDRSKIKKIFTEIVYAERHSVKDDKKSKGDYKKHIGKSFDDNVIKLLPELKDKYSSHPVIKT